MTMAPSLSDLSPGRSVAAAASEADIRERLAVSDFRGAFDVLLERFKDRVFRLACGFLRDETQAEDLAQEVFVKVWKALPGYNGEASLSTWIYTITRNTCLTELKRRARRPTVSLQDPALEAAADALPALQTTDPETGTGLDVQSLLAALPERSRRVITLFYLEQKKYEEVAELLGMPLGTVKTLLFRAKKELLRLASRPAASTPVREPETAYALR